MNDTPPSISETQPKTSAMAITSFVLGILAVVLTIICIGPLLAIPAIICGHLACSRINRSGGQLTGKGFATAGFITGYVSLALLFLMLPIAVPNFIKARETAQMNACINNLRQIDGAKQAWVLEQRKSKGDLVTTTDVSDFLKPSSLTCPKGGVYQVNHAGEHPTCSIPTHRIPEP